MANFNKVFLLGNLTRDPQLSYTPSQTAVVDFGIATNRKWKGADGQQKEEVCFVDCRAFGRTAENINKYCQKGRPLLVEGRLTYDSWTGQDGAKKSRLRVTVENFQFIGSGQGGQGGQSQGYNQGQSQAAQQSADADIPAGDDDIPF